MHLGLPDLGKYPPSQQEAMFKDARMEVLPVISDDFSKKTTCLTVSNLVSRRKCSMESQWPVSCKAFDGNVDALGLKSTGNAP